MLLAGSERWITRPLARRLRRYVSDGGRVASFGTDSLRRGVTLRTRSGGRRHALAPDAADGHRPVRRPPGASSARSRARDADPDRRRRVLRADDRRAAARRLLVSFEESAPELPAHAKLLAAIGEPLTDAETAQAEQSGKPARELRPSLTAIQLGKGTVIRVGLPQWTQHLRDPDVAQVTSNIADILRGVTPRIRSEG